MFTVKTNMYTLSQYKDSVAGILSGLSLNTVADLNGAIERAARTLVQKADIPEASNTQNITLYNGVFDYPCDTRIFGTAITDIRPQGNSRAPWNSTTKIYGEQFDLRKNLYPSGTSSTFEYHNGTPIIRIKTPQTIPQIILDSCTSTNGWTGSGTVSNLTTSQAIYYQNNASIRFKVSTGTGNLTKTLQSPILAENYENVGVAFLALQIPQNVSNLTNITLRIGSDSSNYDYVTVTNPFIGDFENNLWQLVAFDFASSVTIGSPDWSNIKYIEVIFNISADINNIYIGDLFMSLPSPAQILFQTAAIFLPENSTTSIRNITNNNDQIILNDAAYNIFLYEGALSILENTSGGMGDSFTARINSKLNGTGPNDLGLYAMYRGDNPSQELRQTENWYNPNFGAGYNGYNSRV